ncbi:hypothetical protein J2T13_003529 [Paenibacillus sp. DS2015]
MNYKSKKFALFEFGGTKLEQGEFMMKFMGYNRNNNPYSASYFLP